MSMSTRPHGNLVRRADTLAARIAARQPPAPPVDVEAVKAHLLARLAAMRADPTAAPPVVVDPDERYIRLQAIRAMLRERVARARRDMSGHVRP